MSYIHIGIAWHRQEGQVILVKIYRYYQDRINIVNITEGVIFITVMQPQKNHIDHSFLKIVLNLA